MKTCLNCDHLYLKRHLADKSTWCTIGHWELYDGEALPQVLKQNKGCGDWKLLDSLRGTRGAKREW